MSPAPHAARLSFAANLIRESHTFQRIRFSIGKQLTRAAASSTRGRIKLLCSKPKARAAAHWLIAKNRQLAAIAYPLLPFARAAITRNNIAMQGKVETVKFNISQTELQNALGVVSKGAATHSTLPILSGVHLHAEDDALILQTTDLDRSIQYRVPALVEEEGEIVVPAKLFTDIAKNLPDGAVHFANDDNNATITCSSSKFTIHTMPAEDFPGFPSLEVDQSIEIPFNEFADMVKKVARVVSRDETRAILTGVFLTTINGNLRMVATDSYRLALADNKNVSGLGDFNVTISGVFLREIAALPASERPVVISVSNNQIMVEYQGITYINRRLEGNFPNYQQLLPKDYKTRVTLNVKELLAAVKRASLLSNTSAPVKFDINAASQTVQLSSVSQDVGTVDEVLRVRVEGEDTVIAFNSAFIQDGLQAMDTDDVFLDLQSTMRPGIFRATGTEEFLYLVMPVRIPA